MKRKGIVVQISAEFITIILLLAMGAYLRFSWSDIPDQVPGHYNIAGQVDRWGNKSELLAIPIICGVLYVLLTLVTYYPPLWNLPLNIGKEDKAKTISLIKNMMCIMKAEMVLCFGYISFQGIRLQPLSPYFTLLSLLVLAITFGIYLFRIYNTSK